MAELQRIILSAPRLCLGQAVLGPGTRLSDREIAALTGLRIPLPQRKGLAGSMSDFSQQFAQDTYRFSLIRRFDDLISALARLDSKIDIGLLIGAFLLGAESHVNQHRLSGLPYLVHPLGAAEVAVEAGYSDPVLVKSVLLHDAVEDKGCTLDKIRKEFGPEIANLVEGVTKFERQPGEAREAHLRANLERRIESAINDSRVLLIIFCDRIDNMKTLGSQPAEAQIRIAQETHDIIAPLANSLGCRWFYRELMDLALSYLRPDDYRRIKNELDGMHQAQAAEIARIQQELKTVLTRTESAEQQWSYPPIGLVEIAHTPRRPFEIFEQEAIGGREALKVEPTDVLSFRILVNCLADADRTVGRIARRWEPTQERIVDLLAGPGPNGYRAKHLTKVGEYGETFRFQVTTEEYHQTNEHGIFNPADPEFQRSFLELLLRFIRMQDVPFQSIRKAVASGGKQIKVYAVAPGQKREQFFLPGGATARDLAFALEKYEALGSLGIKATHCEINRRRFPVGQALKEGDQVHVYSNPDRSPALSELSTVGTLLGFRRMMEYFRINASEALEQRGRAMLEAELSGYYLRPEDFEQPEILTLTASWLGKIRGQVRGINFNVSASTADQFKQVLFFIGAETEGVSAADVLRIFAAKFDENKARMTGERTKSEVKEGIITKVLGKRKRQRAYKAVVKAQVLDRPGELAKITGPLGALGLNLTREESKGKRLELEIEITWDLHLIQIRRILESAGASDIQIETRDKPKKKDSSV